MDPRPDTQAQLERLQAALRSRRSTPEFAGAIVAALASLVLAGAAGKLMWDSREVWGQAAAAVVGSVSLCGLAYAVVRYLRGRRALGTELEQWRALAEARRELGLDDPSSLLPR